MPKSIDTAPKDGKTVRVQWRDRDGVENTSLAQYRATGPDGGPFGAGWWTYIDSDTMKRIEPHSWSGGDDEEEDQ